MKSLKYLLMILFFFLILSPNPTYAHDLFGLTAFSGGMLHPILGPDHLLAMLTVGIISSKIGGKAVWAVPSMFVLALILGSIAGTYHIKFPLLEEGIALSVLLLGIGVFFRGERNNPFLTLFVVGIFGLYHGNAHGSLILSSQKPLMFAVGFVVTTIGLHLMGLILGTIWQQNQKAQRRFRSCGIFIAFAGVILLTDVILRTYFNVHY